MVRSLMAKHDPLQRGIMAERDRSSERYGDRSENDVTEAGQSAREEAARRADDRGGSRDGERLEPGEAGDRDQLDNDGGRVPSRR